MGNSLDNTNQLNQVTDEMVHDYFNSISSVDENVLITKFRELLNNELDIPLVQQLDLIRKEIFVHQEMEHYKALREAEIEGEE